MKGMLSEWSLPMVTPRHTHLDWACATLRQMRKDAIAKLKLAYCIIAWYTILFLDMLVNIFKQRKLNDTFAHHQTVLLHNKTLLNFQKSKFPTVNWKCQTPFPRPP